MAEAFERLRPPAPAAPAVSGLRIAVCQTAAWEFAEATTRDAMALAAERLAGAGADVVTLTLPPDFDLLPTQHHKAILHGEGRAAFLNLKLQHGERFHAELRARAENREGFTPAQICEAYDTAGRCRPLFDALAADYHAVLTPSSAGTAPVGRWPGNPVFNQMWTLLHVPCVNVPCSPAGNGLPIGLTLTGARFSDFALLDVAERIAPVLHPEIA
jgi:Asp-tRNA(Asn)/Glu-tRNA(Gln) amidotransferase A subunit family amidase